MAEVDDWQVAESAPRRQLDDDLNRGADGEPDCQAVDPKRKGEPYRRDNDPGVVDGTSEAAAAD